MSISNLSGALGDHGLSLDKMTCRYWTWGLSQVSFVNALEINSRTYSCSCLARLFSSIIWDSQKERNEWMSDKWTDQQWLWVRAVLFLRKGLTLLPTLASNLPSSCFGFGRTEICASPNLSFKYHFCSVICFKVWSKGICRFCRCVWGVCKDKAVCYINNARTSFALSTILTFVSVVQTQLVTPWRESD